MIGFKDQPIGLSQSDGELSLSVVFKLVTKHRWAVWYVGVVAADNEEDVEDVGGGTGETGVIAG